LKHRTRFRGKLRFAVAAALALLGMVCAAACGYLSRSPLGRSESLTALVDFRAVFLGRCGDLEETWREFRRLPRYQEFSGTPAGRAFLASSPFARAAERVNSRGRVLGLSILNIFDLLGDEVIIAGVPGQDGGRVFLCASRVRPAANLLLGVYSAVMRPEALHTAAGDWWMMVEPNVGVGWTKVGDVLAASNDRGLLGRFVAAARRGRRKKADHMASLVGGVAPRLAVRIPSVRRADGPMVPGTKLPSVCVLSLRLGPRWNRPAPAGGAGAAAFRRFACGYMPEDTCMGLVWRLDPVKVWRLALNALAESARDSVVRYVEDHLCAVLDADSFEDDVLRRMTGDFALAMSRLPDPWLGLASGQVAPTVAVVLRIRSDPELDRKLLYALLEAAGALESGDRRFVAEVREEQYRGRRIRALRVRRRGTHDGPAAGYFVVPDELAAGYSLIVASTSVGWLRRAIDAHAGTGAAVTAQDWFRGVSRPVSPAKSVFAFARGDVVAGAFARMRGPGARGAGGPEQWLQLLGAVGLDGMIDKDGAVRADVRIAGGRLGRLPR